MARCKKQPRESLPLDELDHIIIKTIAADEKTGRKERKITLSEVFNLLSERRLHGNRINHTNDNIINSRDIKKAKAMLIAKFPGLYADQIEGWPASNHRFLIDENLSQLVTIDLWHEFGRSTHIKHENISGAKDPAVWRWAVKNRVDAIITRDKRMKNAEQDLGLIAVRHAYNILHRDPSANCRLEAHELPLMIQIDAPEREAADIMKRHKQAIIKHLQNRRTPYIRLTETDCFSGPSYEDIKKHDWETLKTKIGALDQLFKKAKHKIYSSVMPS